MLVTGVGMVATAAWCARALARERYDLALNLGVCGSFDRVAVARRPWCTSTGRPVAGDCGAEDGDAFLTIQQLELLGENEFPFVEGRLVNQSPPPLPRCTVSAASTASR